MPTLREQQPGQTGQNRQRHAKMAMQQLQKIFSFDTKTVSKQPKI
jgi:hypothetical protein